MPPTTPELLNVTSPEHARALGHPTRHRLLLELGADGATVSQLAHRIPTNKGNVAHHLKVLVDAGLVRPGRTRTVRGGTEQYYVRAARRIKFESSDSSAPTHAMLANLAAELGADSDPLLNHRVLRLTERQAAALRRHLDRVVNELSPAAEPEQTYGVVVGLYRRSAAAAIRGRQDRRVRGAD